MISSSSLRSLAAVAVLLVSPLAVNAATIAPAEDVMTSSFFTGTNLVRGYAGDNRPVMRVSTNNPFGTVGAETIYITFDYDFAANFSGPVNAVLSVQSVAGGFGADAGAGKAFTVSAHALSADPLASIADNTNPGGPIDWLTFANQNILAAAPAAATVIDDFGTVTFDVSAIVNDWISGANTVFAIALTGKNDVSGLEFLHGFLNNTEQSGATSLAVTAVPVPGAGLLLTAPLVVLARRCRRQARV